MRLTVEQMRNLLVGALEGGSNYWYVIPDYVLAPGLTIEDFTEGGKMQPKGDYFHWSQLIPTTPGCTLLVQDDEHNIAAAINLKALQHGAKVMREKYPRHFGDVIAEDGDSTTADVFLQCAVFGDVIYG